MIKKNDYEVLISHNKKNVVVCVIILTYNEYFLTKNCLYSILDNTPKEYNYKIILIDDHSRDNSYKKLVKDFWKIKEVDILRNNQNFKFSKANNLGIKYSKERYNPKYYFLLNNDTLVTKGWLENCIKVAESKNDIGIVGCKQKNFEGALVRCAGYIGPFGVKYYYGNEIKEVNWVMGASMLIKREVIEKIGLIDEGFYPAYYEETDFIFRAKKAGFKIFFSPKSIILHKVSGYLKREGNEYFIRTFYKNRIRFFVGRYGWIYFIPRLVVDLIKQRKNLPLLLESYKSGLKSLKEKPLI
ncbi:MAG: glycosyltransferase family 2 protein [Candidatus Pacearchaeota archaeon]